MSDQLTDLLLAGPVRQVDRTAVADVGRELKARLSQVAGGTDRYRPSRLSSFSLQSAAGDRGTRRVPTPFEVSVRTCRRTIGLILAGRCAVGESATPVQAAAEVLDIGLDQGWSGFGEDWMHRNRWWTRWYRDLDRPARAVVRSEACNWATRLVAALEWRRLGPEVVVGERDATFTMAESRGLTLLGRSDVRIARPSGDCVMNVFQGWAPSSWQVMLGLTGLVRALGDTGSGSVCRVVGLWPSSGQIRVAEIDSELLAEVADAIVGAVQGVDVARA